MNAAYKIVAWLFILVKCVYCQHYVGDLCTITGTNLSGSCQLLLNCPRALHDLTLGIIPQNCGFEGIEPIVCCIGSSPNPVTIVTPTTQRTIGTTKTTPTKWTSPTTASTPTTPLPVGAKSILKCREYQAYVYTKSGEDSCRIQFPDFIVDGKKAITKEFPHMALVGFDGENGSKEWACGGSLISEQYILTAGHCLYNAELGEAKYVKIGVLERRAYSADDRPQEFTVSEKIKYPDYKSFSLYNDIALLKLDKPAILNPYARPACLHIEKNINSNFAVVTGWGRVGYTSSISESLLKVTLELFTFPDCNNSYQNDYGTRKLKNGINDTIQLCAGSHNSSKDSCRGDSGGPLQIVDDDKNTYCMYSIIGVTSFGKSCGFAHIPGVYTRVSSYIEWIESTIWP